MNCISHPFKYLFVTSGIACNISFYHWQASAYLLPTRTRPKEGRERRQREKRSTIVTTVCPIREEAPTVMRFFLTYAYRHKALLVRDPRAGKTRCSRIRVFVDRANDCRCIHIQNHVHRRRPIRSPRK